MTDLPQGWQTKSLGEWEDGGVVKLGRGKIISKRDIASNPGDYPIYSSAGLNGGEFGRYGSYLFDEELITWSIDGGGHLFHRPKHKFSVTNVGGWLRILDSEVFGYKYLTYVLSWLQSTYPFDWSRKAHPSVIRVVYEMVVAPPLAEQERIVEILEEQFSRLDSALASVKAVREKAKAFRRSLLHSAFSGELTGGTEGWQGAPLEEVLETTIGGVWGGEAGSDEVDVDVLRVTELKANGLLEPSTAARRSVSAKQVASRSLKVGDIILEKSGGGPKSPVGRVGRITKSTEGFLFSNFMQLLRPNASLVLPNYLFEFLVYFQATSQTAPMQTATTNIRNIKMPAYLALSVPLPPLATQERIVSLLEEQFSRLDKALEVANQLEARIASERRSLLHSAFTGALTATWRQNND